jgi:hypothetical protein
VIIDAKFEGGLSIWRPPVAFKTSDPSYPVCLLATAGDKITEKQLWHLRLGHLNYGDMDKLQYMANGVRFSSVAQNSMCVSCCKGKMSARPFAGHNVKAKKPFGVVYADLWGPVTCSMQGNKYALLLVDEASTYTWVYFMHNKSQASDFIIEFILQQDRQGNKVQVLRTDNGGEFMSSQFKHFLKEKGIQHATSPAYTPQFQGKVERMNRTVGGQAHAMRVGAELGEQFWDLAWDCAVFLRNRSPTAANAGNMTPFEAIFGRRPDLHMLKVFGCRAEALVPKQVRLKGEDKTTSGIFVGYDNMTKSFKFLPDGARRWVAVRTMACEERIGARLGGGGRVQLRSPGVRETLLVETQGGQRQGEPQWHENKMQPEELMDDEQMDYEAQSKGENRARMVAAKSMPMMTRGQLKKGLRDRYDGGKEMGMVGVGVDSFGAEVFGGGGVQQAVPKSVAEALRGDEKEQWAAAI